MYEGFGTKFELMIKRQGLFIPVQLYSPGLNRKRNPEKFYPPCTPSRVFLPLTLPSPCKPYKPFIIQILSQHSKL